MGSLTATLADPLVEPAPAGWDEFVEAQRLPPVWRSRLLRAADWCTRSASSMVLVQEAGSAAPVAIFHARHTGPLGLRRFSRPGPARAASLTVCRTGPTLGTGVAFAAGTDQRDRAEAVRVFETALSRRVGLAGRLIGYWSLPAEQLAAIPARGRLRFRQGANMVLDNEWSDLSGYLASLPKAWRKRLRQIRRAVEAGGARVELTTSIDPAEACWLAEVVRRRYLPRRLPGPPWPARYFDELGRLPGAWFLSYRDGGGRLLAFVAGHDTGEELYAGVWGNRDETDGGRRHLYFDSYLRQAELMLSRGRRRLVLGAGMAELKARYGARGEPRWGLAGLR
jgi:hypothetical protein